MEIDLIQVSLTERFLSQVGDHYFDKSKIKLLFLPILNSICFKQFCLCY